MLTTRNTNPHPLSPRSGKSPLMAWTAVTAAATVTAVLLAAAPAGAASFRCSTASNTAERTICANPTLNRLDELMSAEFFGIRASLGHQSKSQFQGEQRRWLRQRNGCGSDRKCLERSYLDRIVLNRRWQN